MESERRARWRREHPDYSRQYYLANRASALERARKSRRTAKGRAIKLVAAARHRAKEYGLEFTITVEDVERRITRGFCEGTGLAFDMTGKMSRGRRHSPRAPTIDRINPAKGYTPRNIAVVCRQFNCAKSEWPLSDLIEMAEALVRKKSKPSIH